MTHTAATLSRETPTPAPSIRRPGAAIRHAFGIDSGWDRPVDPARAWRADAAIAVFYAAVTVVLMDSARSLGKLDTAHIGNLTQYAIVLIPVVGLVVRRSYPIAALTLAIAHFAAVALVWPEMSPVFGLQIYYFFSLFSAIAWARQRTAALWLALAMGAVSVLWVAGDMIFGDAWDRLSQVPSVGPFSPPIAALLEVSVSTLTFLSSAIAAGLTAWWSARRESTARQQAVTIERQVEQLNREALNEERLRIARELHDAVGHSVAVMGIQAAAAQRLLERDPVQAAEALTQSQTYARGAARDLRFLLNALRAPTDDAEDALAVNPGLDGLGMTVARFADLGLEVTTTVEGPIDVVPKPLSLCAGRVLQEALTNVQRHAATDAADVLVRVVADSDDVGRVRVRVTNGGAAREGTSGSGLGLLGMRERVSLFGGTVTTGIPPEGHGFRVEALLPWSAED